MLVPTSTPTSLSRPLGSLRSQIDLPLHQPHHHLLCLPQMLPPIRRLPQLSQLLLRVKGLSLGSRAGQRELLERRVESGEEFTFGGSGAEEDLWVGREEVEEVVEEC